MAPFIYVTVLTFFWGVCKTKPFPAHSITYEELIGNDDTTGNDDTMMLNFCDFIRAFQMAELLKSEILLLNYQSDKGGDDAKKRYMVPEFLVRFCLLGLDKRQSEPGYNVNSFGLRFGKRDTKFNLNSFGLKFGKKRQLSVPMYNQDNIACE